MRKKNPATTSTAIKDAVSMGLIEGKPVSRRRWVWFGCGI